MTKHRFRPRFEQLEDRAVPAVYYVATTGSNGNAGTSAAPWQTLQYAADRVAAGDTVVVRAGDYAGFDLTDRRHRRRPDHLPGRPRRPDHHAQPGHHRRDQPGGGQLDRHRGVHGRQPAAGRHPVGRQRPRHHPREHLRQQRRLGHPHRVQRRPADREQRDQPVAAAARHLRLQQRRPAGHPRQHVLGEPPVRHPHERGPRLRRGRDHLERPGREQRHLRQRPGRRVGDQLRRGAELGHPQQPDLQRPRQRHLAVPDRRRRRVVGQRGGEQQHPGRVRRAMGAEHPGREHRQHGPQQRPLQLLVPRQHRHLGGQPAGAGQRLQRGDGPVHAGRREHGPDPGRSGGRPPARTPTRSSRPRPPCSSTRPAATTT